MQSVQSVQSVTPFFAAGKSFCVLLWPFVATPLPKAKPLYLSFPFDQFRFHDHHIFDWPVTVGSFAGGYGSDLVDDFDTFYYFTEDGIVLIKMGYSAEGFVYFALSDVSCQMSGKSLEEWILNYGLLS